MSRLPWALSAPALFLSGRLISMRPSDGAEYRRPRPQQTDDDDEHLRITFSAQRPRPALCTSEMIRISAQLSFWMADFCPSVEAFLPPILAYRRRAAAPQRPS